MLEAVMTYLSANYFILVLAAVGYGMYREIGAATAAAIGQYFVNAGSASWSYTMADPAQSCTTLSYLAALVCLPLFALVPTIHLELRRRSRAIDSFSSFSMFWGLLFAATSANHFTLASMDVPGALDAAGGSLLLAALSGSAAFAAAKLHRDHLSLSRRTLSTTSETSASDFKISGQPLVVGLPGSGTSAPSIEQAAAPSPDSASNGETKFASIIGSVSHRHHDVSVLSPHYLFNKNEFFIFRDEHLKELEDLLRRDPPRVIKGLQVAICCRLGRVPVAGDEHAFVRAYAAQFRKRLEISYPAYFFTERFERLAA